MFRDGELVVGRDECGDMFVGAYRYRGPQFHTCEVHVNGLDQVGTVMLQYPNELERYSIYKHKVTLK